MIGADAYAKDCVEAVKKAHDLMKEILSKKWTKLTYIFFDNHINL
jgi:hypothetical protein